MQLAYVVVLSTNQPIIQLNFHYISFYFRSYALGILAVLYPSEKHGVIGANKTI